MLIYYIYERRNSMNFLKQLLSYRILKIYISYQDNISTIISRAMISCPRNISNEDIVEYISENILKTFSPSRSIDMMKDKNIHTIKTNDRDYRKYDIVAKFSRVGIIDIRRDCKYKIRHEYALKNDILLKMKI